MSAPPLLTRREVLQRAALSAATLSLAQAAPRVLAGEPASAPSPTPDRRHSLALGVATISLRDRPIPAVVAVLRQLAIDRVSIFRTHANFEKGTPAECRVAAEAFRAAGIAPVTTSVVYLTNDEATMRRAFENVRAAGLRLMTCSPSPDSLPLAGRFVKEYDIRLAIHNHGPEDKTYPSPYDVLKLVAPLDPRIGLCIDVGHTMRAGVDPAEAIRRCAARLYDLHLKDSLAAPGAEDIPVEVGRGHMNIRAILAALLEVGYAGTAAFEYEKTEGNPALGLAESVGYVRGQLATLS